MRLTRLGVTNLRALRQTEVEFDEAFTLLIGVNGVGKSTVLDALRTTLSVVWSELGIYKRGTLSFTERDITIDQPTMEAELAFRISGQACALSMTERRANEKDNPEWEGGFTGDAATTIHVPDVRRLGMDPREVSEVDGTGDLRCSADSLKRRMREKPLAMYYSTRRSLFRERKATQAVLKNTASAPYVQALDHRALQVVELATWWRAEAYIATLGNERAAQAARHIGAMKRAGTAIVEGLADLDVRNTEEDEPTLEATKDGRRIDVRFLSDGERSLLSLALDITRRLAQAYPGLRDPADEGHAIILIDELDLHLHPRWQRRIPNALTETFPNCQFVCTTHSPQILGEVDPRRVRLLSPGGGVDEVAAARGLDYNYLLETAFGDEDRSVVPQRQLDAIFEMLGRRELEGAEAEIEAFERDYSPEGEDIHRARTLLDRLKRIGR